jgi:hypothetical protein
MVPSAGPARLGACTAHRGGARHGRPPVISREPHAVILAARTRQSRRQLCDVLVGVVEKATPDAGSHGRTIGSRRSPRRRRRSGGRWIPRYGRDPVSRRLQHSQLFSVVSEVPVVGRKRTVPRRRLARSVARVLWWRSWRNGSRRDLRLLFYPASRLAESSSPMSGGETGEARLAQPPVSPHAVWHAYRDETSPCPARSCVDRAAGQLAGRLSDCETPPRGEQGALGACFRGARGARLARRNPHCPICDQTRARAEGRHVQKGGIFGGLHCDGSAAQRASPAAVRSHCVVGSDRSPARGALSGSMASYRLVPRHRRATPEEELAMRLGIGTWA